MFRNDVLGRSGFDEAKVFDVAYGPVSAFSDPGISACYANPGFPSLAVLVRIDPAKTLRNFLKLDYGKRSGASTASACPDFPVAKSYFFSTNHDRKSECVFFK